jgi:putative salt-induced outer membrane protein
MNWKKAVTLFVTICVILISTTIMAQDKKWKDEGELSYVVTDGNTQVTNFSAKNTLTYNATENDKIIWKIASLYGRAEVTSFKSGTTKEITKTTTIVNQDSTDLKYEHSFQNNASAYISCGYLKDRFAGIEQRTYEGVGIGYTFLNTEKTILKAEAGLLYVNEDYTCSVHTVAKLSGQPIDDTDYLSGRGYGEYEYKFNEKSRFKQTLEYLYDFDESENWNGISETSIISSLSSIFSLKTSYTIKYDNLPVAGLEKRDTILGVTLLINL